ncbi:RNA-protein complex protein Nop10 [Archaeoglobus neptunius]|uniref:RNA-protein complex protein Nop10 n=1 Tax=Archaeoglobus neptunius TaxID=2798580 RepID=UPI00192771CF|nr:RNA-protein complex protein Nop10 [Archaeoglobus neptunius]
MKVSMRKCPNCRRYTLKETCPKCGAQTYMPIPPRFSIEDPYGKYRRRLRREKGFFVFRR